MKLNAALAKSVLLAASMGIVVPVLAQTPARPGAARPTAKGEEEKEGEVKGIAIERPNGQWLGLTMDGLNLRLTFYNEKKNPIAPDMVRATARWRRPGVGDQERAVLNPSGDGVSLTGNHIVRKPWTFVVFFALVNDRDEVVESYQVPLDDSLLTPED